MKRVSPTLDAAIRPAVEGMGYELVGVEYVSQGKHSVLRIYIDRAEGILVDDCARVSHQVSGVLDVEDPIKGQYSLEVSSPGLDRPLFSIEHFVQFSGRQVKIRLTAPLNGQRKFAGIIQSVEAETVLLECDGEQVQLPFGDIEQARLVPEL